MFEFKERFASLKRLVAQNVERGSYYESSYDDIGGVDRGPIGGDSGAAPVNSAKPNPMPNEERKKRIKYPGYFVGDPLMVRDVAQTGDNMTHNPGESMQWAGGEQPVLVLD